MISIDVTIAAPPGLYDNSPVEFAASVLRTVGPVFHSTVEAVRSATQNASVRAGWQEFPPLVAPSEVAFTAVNTNPAAAFYELGTQPHEIPNPPHWIPIAPLLTFYEETRGLSEEEARSAAYGFQRWAADNPFTIAHPGTLPHRTALDAWEDAEGPLTEAAQEAFAQSVTARFA